MLASHFCALLASVPASPPPPMNDTCRLTCSEEDADCRSLDPNAVPMRADPTDVLSCVCARGYYDEGDAAIDCRRCMAAAECELPGVTLAMLQLEAGYWRSGERSTQVLRCGSRDSGTHCCTGEPASPCSEGNEGPLCALCSDGWGPPSSGAAGQCVRCDGNSGSAVSGGLIVLLLLLTFGALLGCWAVRQRRLVRRLLRHWRAQLEVAVPAIVVKLKLLWTMAQMLSLSTAVFGVSWPHALRKAQRSIA